MIFIEKVVGREILESRGLPTIEVSITLSNGIKTKASSPSGTSYGTNEAVEVRDKDLGRYLGYGVTRAVNNVNKTIAPRIYKKDPIYQFDIDELLAELDGTPNKAHLGANTILATSMAVAKAGALLRKINFFEHLHSLYKKQHNFLFKENSKNSANSQGEYVKSPRKMTIPEPIFNIIQGQESKESKLDFQDFMIILKGIPEFSEKLRYASEVNHQVQKILVGNDYELTLQNEKAYTSNISNDETALTTIMNAINQAENKFKNNVFIGLDVAATAIYNHSKRKYRMNSQQKYLTGEELVNYLLELEKKYPMIFFEDPLAYNDYQNWKKISQSTPQYIGIVGDDLFNGNLNMIERNKKEKWANSISIKPNQIGSLKDILTTIIMAQQQELKIVLSHRSGETNDDFLSDIAVAVGADYFRAGAPNKGERIAKYNRMMIIEEKLKILQNT